MPNLKRDNAHGGSIKDGSRVEAYHDGANPGEIWIILGGAARLGSNCESFSKERIMTHLFGNYSWDLPCVDWLYGKWAFLRSSGVNWKLESSSIEFVVHTKGFSHIHLARYFPAFSWSTNYRNYRTHHSITQFT